MGKYLKLFETHSAYSTYINGQDKELPNVSYCENENEVHYNPYEPPSRVITAIYDISDTQHPTVLTWEDGWNNVESVMVTRPNGTTFELTYNDLVEYDPYGYGDPTYGYQFDATGNHIIEYTLKPNVNTIYGDFLNTSNKLISVTIPNTVSAIGQNAFVNCRGLASITIPNSVSSIGDDAFYMCYFTSSNFINNSSLDEVTNNYWGATIVDSDTDGICIKNNVIVRYRGNATSVTIPNNVTSIGQGAFSSCMGLTNVTIGSGVTSIGDNAFQYCSGLTNITIPNGVTTINSRAFFGCSSLTSITIGSGVTSIGGNAFIECSSLTNVTVEATTPPTMGSYTFSNVSGRKIYVPSASVSTYQSASGWSQYAADIEAIP